MRSIIILFGTLFALACSQQETNETHSVNEEITQASGTQNEKDTAQSEKYFPLMDFMRSEIRTVDSLPIGIKVYKTVSGKTDSAYLKPEEFHQMAEQFLTPELDKEQFKKTYTESSFYDRSDKTSTFHYETKKPDATIRRIDVITRATDTYDKVTSLYIEKSATQDQSVKKLIWKPGQEFTIIEQNSVTRVVWQY